MPLADVPQCTLKHPKTAKSCCTGAASIWHFDMLHAVLGGPSHKPRIGCQTQGVRIPPLWVLLCFDYWFSPLCKHTHTHSLYITVVIMFFYIILSRSLSLSLSLSLSSNATGLMQRHNRVHMVLRAGVRMLALAHALRSHLKHFRVSKSQVHVVKYIEAKQLFTKTR